MKFKQFMQSNLNENDLKYLNRIQPTQKDFDRIYKVWNSEDKLKKMANSITDPVKLVQRTKALLTATNGYDGVFGDRMMELGFTKEEIVKVRSFYYPSEPLKRDKKSYSDTVYEIKSLKKKGKIKNVAKSLSDCLVLFGTLNMKKDIALVINNSNYPFYNFNGLDVVKVKKTGFIDTIDVTSKKTEKDENIIHISEYAWIDEEGAVRTLIEHDDTSYSFYEITNI